MKFQKRSHGQRAIIPTTSMSDIIFMLLLFFMVTTTLRDQEVFVKYTLPQSESAQKIENKRLISYIWVGTDRRIQINDRIVKMEEIQGIMVNKRKVLPNMIVSMRIDRNSDMGLVTDIQQELRKADARRINYSAMLKR